jgi:hypothetical protein
MAAYLPPDWPTGVHPPGTEEFERTAVTWLLDVVPPDYRLHGVLQRHPIALATLARRHLAACVEGARQGYRTARTELGGVLPVSGLDAVLAAYRSEGHRLVTAARAAELVERALRGREFTPQPDGQHQHERPGQQAPPGQKAPGEQAPAGEKPAAGEKAAAGGQAAVGQQKATAGVRRQVTAGGRPPTAATGKQHKQPAAGKQRQKQPAAAGKQRRG